ncbi:MAG TPA: hypothetical protein VGC10_01220 [Sphingomonas sp.]
MSNSTLIIIGAAVLVLALVFLVLARTGRKPVEGPAAGDRAVLDATTDVSPVAPDEAPPPAEPIADGPPDPLTRMKGLGPKAQTVLHGLGITHYAQIAAWTDADVARIDPQMGAFKGRIARDRWIEQARYLAADDLAGFESVFGKLG